MESLGCERFLPLGLAGGPGSTCGTGSFLAAFSCGRAALILPSYVARLVQQRVLVAEHERRQSSSGRNLAEDLDSSRLFDHRMAVATSFKPTNVWTDSPTVNNLKRDDLPLLRWSICPSCVG